MLSGTTESHYYSYYSILFCDFSQVVQFQRAHISSGQLCALFAAIVGVPGKTRDFCPICVG